MVLKKISYCFIFITFLLSGISVAQNSLILSDTSVTTNQLFTQRVFLSAEDSIVGFQFDLKLPGNVEFQNSIIVSNTLANHTVSSSEIETGVIRVLCFSLSNTSIPNSTAPIISILCRAGDTPGNFDINLENATLSNSSSQNVLNQIVNGSLLISGTTKVEDENTSLNEKKRISVYPNPFNGSMNVNYYADNQTLQKLTVYDILGKAIFKKQLIPKSKGYNQENIDLSNLASGIYLLSINDSKNSNIKKIILLK